MSVIVSDNIQIVNTDRVELRRIKESSGSFDNGACKIMEGLQMFCEDLLAQYENGRVPYEALFNALVTVINAAKEKQEVRDACMTGIIRLIKRPKEVPEKKTPRKIVHRKSYDKAAVTAYAVNRTSKEIAEKFGFTSLGSCKVYLSKNKIPHKMTKGGRPVNKEKLNRIKQLSSVCTVRELAEMSLVYPGTMRSYTGYHGIHPVGSNKRKS